MTPRRCSVRKLKHVQEPGQTARWEETILNGWLHGIFQGQDHEEAGAFCVVELDDGSFMEPLTEYVRMLEPPTEGAAT